MRICKRRKNQTKNRKKKTKQKLSFFKAPSTRNVDGAFFAVKKTDFSRQLSTPKNTSFENDTINYQKN
uniref:Uncharacterized protein n=1 Tax=Iridovirus LCIVAC01 TaxID=2506607 RepID=A0A481YPN6_9VIRU|nr:MAG: hypothetical protein LCIVAC01_00100 [Iridovirus LCIVAC01]